MVESRELGFKITEAVINPPMAEGAEGRSLVSFLSVFPILAEAALGEVVWPAFVDLFK
jgi:hypothetical protein